MIIIYTNKEESLDDALKTLTDDWIADGNACDQTTIDLKDAVILLQSDNTALRATLQKITDLDVDQDDIHRIKHWAKEALA